MSLFDILVQGIEKFTDILTSLIYFNVLGFLGNKDINLPFIIAFLIGGYIILAFKLRWIQFTKLKYSIKYAFGKKKDKKKGDVSSLKTLLASVASCTGMNAVAGMVFMVAVGGPGTIFWMPIIAFLCMPFRFAEVYLSHTYREQRGKEVLGGPFDYIKKGLGELKLKKLGKYLALAYALIMIFCGTTGVSMYEANQCISVISGSFNTLADKRMLLSIVVVLAVLFIIIGGTKRIMNFFGIVLPVIAIIYILASLIVIGKNIDKLGDAIVMIFQDAIHPKAIAGGFFASMCMCARKFCLSNETGLGTSGMVHASSTEQDSIKEATSAMMTPLINCFCVCLMSCFVLILTGFYQHESTKDGAVAIFNAFGSVNKFLPYIITILVPMLAFNVLIGWNNYIVKCTKYCFKSSKAVKIAIALSLCCSFMGGILNDFNLIMQIIDSIMMLLIIVNVPVVVLLSNKVWKALKVYKFK